VSCSVVRTGHFVSRSALTTRPSRIRGYRSYSGSGKSVLRRKCPFRNYLLTVCRPMIFAKLASAGSDGHQPKGTNAAKSPHIPASVTDYPQSYSITAAVTTCSPDIHPPRTDHYPRTRTGQPTQRGTSHRSNLPAQAPAPRLLDQTDYRKTCGPRSSDC
jgi:hypothetical protein